MRYVNGLIPDEYKVRPDYFKSYSESSRPFSVKAKIISRFTACLFFLFALANLMHPPLCLLAITLGAGLLPSIHRWLERKGQFNFTPAIKRTLYAIMLIPVGLMTGYYSNADAKLAHERLQQQQEAKCQAAIAAVKDSLRRDSLYLNLSLLKRLQGKGNMSGMEVQLALNRLDSMAIKPEEKKDIADVKFTIAKDKALTLVKAGKYHPAVDALTSLLLQAPNDATLLYNRALCYDKIGLQESAVQDLRSAMQAGSTIAEKYHDKINPVRKKIIGYVTRCCDGTTSSARGRGACSWHGGVCNWNEPEYETYRKYQ